MLWVGNLWFVFKETGWAAPFLRAPPGAPEKQPAPGDAYGETGYGQGPGGYGPQGKVLTSCVLPGKKHAVLSHSVVSDSFHTGTQEAAMSPPPLGFRGKNWGPQSRGLSWAVPLEASAHAEAGGLCASGSAWCLSPG